jgi:hypothetical protein
LISAYQNDLKTLKIYLLKKNNFLTGVPNIAVMYITGDEKRARKLVIELKKNHYTKLM